MPGDGGLVACVWSWARGRMVYLGADGRWVNDPRAGCRWECAEDAWRELCDAVKARGLPRPKDPHPEEWSLTLNVRVARDAISEFVHLAEIGPPGVAEKGPGLPPEPAPAPTPAGKPTRGRKATSKA